MIGSNLNLPNSNETNSAPLRNPPYKKLFVIMVISTVLFMATSGFLLYQQNRLVTKTPPENPKTQNSNSIASPTCPSPTPNISDAYTRIGECTKDQCLFLGLETPEGFAHLIGYYQSYEADDWGTPATCDGFVVTGGNKTLIDHFDDWINKGNGLNKRINNNLVINIPLDKSFEKTIKSSNISSQIQIGVIRVSPAGRGASTCTPVVDIVTAETAPASPN